LVAAYACDRAWDSLAPHAAPRCRAATCPISTGQGRSSPICLPGPCSSCYSPLNIRWADQPVCLHLSPVLSSVQPWLARLIFALSPGAVRQVHVIVPMRSTEWSEEGWFCAYTL